MSERWTPAPGRNHPLLHNDDYFPLKPHPKYLQSIPFTYGCLAWSSAPPEPILDDVSTGSTLYQIKFILPPFKL